MVVPSFLHRAKSTFFIKFVYEDHNGREPVNPFDLGKSVMRSMVTCAHFIGGISRGYSKPAFALFSDSSFDT